MASVQLSIDAMSGDHGLATTIPAVIRAAKEDLHTRFILVGDQVIIAQHLAKSSIALPENVRIHHASEIVGMDESPSLALRNKKDSSMRVAIDLVKTGEANAAISAGNTGALMATARYVLKMLPGIDRPAIIVALPTSTGEATYMLDMGANVNCSAEQLLQFAVMGSIVAESIDGIQTPKVHLLNIGEEEIKGNTLVQAAAKLIKQHPQINYQGFIESDKLFQGESNVVVCDGFVGNSVLKAAEGVTKFIGKTLNEEFQKNLINKIRGLIAKSILKNAYKKLDPEIHNGSPLLGLKAIVVKSHGSASAKAFYHAMMQAKQSVKHQLPERIAKGLESLQQDS